LGYGQGLSVVLHAAASGGEWWGTDFNPAQAAFAQHLAAVAGARASLFDQPFAEFCQRPDLPDFAFIGLHGIWSWVSDQNRALIVDFVRRRLKPGGVLFISYNSQPGWAALVPLRQLLLDHTRTLSPPGLGVAERIGAALDFGERLLALEPAYAQVNPQIQERLQEMRHRDRRYLAGEYFNQDWQPMSFQELAGWLGQAKLEFAGSALYWNLLLPSYLPEAQRAFLAEIPDPVFRETTLDFLLNTQFRWDYWIKGARRLPASAQAAALRQERVVLIVPRPAVPLKLKFDSAEIDLHPEVYGPLLDLLADHQPRALGDLERDLAGRNLGLARVREAVMMLVAANILHPAQDEAASDRARPATDRLNAHLMAQAQGGGDSEFLASPVTGGGIPVGRFGQLFLLAAGQGQRTAAEWAASAWQVLASQGQKVIKDGQPLMTPEENLAELTRMAGEFAEKGLPTLRALGVAEDPPGPAFAEPGMVLESSFSPSSPWGRSWPPSTAG
jgi:SAM-dependent methyltransferase